MTQPEVLTVCGPLVEYSMNKMSNDTAINPSMTTAEETGHSIMNRRTFYKTVAGGVAGLRSVYPALAAQVASKPKWPDRVFRRLLVDTHVPDWNPELLSRFDAKDYVSTIARAGFQCLMQYAISCAGVCLWPTKVGQVHRGMNGRDYFGEVMEECKRHGLYRVAYFHVVWDNLGYEMHPQWRFRPAEGDEGVMKGRYGYTCINTPVRDYYLALVRELVAAYDFEGLFNDMIIWPGVCYCGYCTERFRKEHAAEPPRIVDWDDPLWRTFQAARQRWLLEFAREFTAAVKQVRPITVEHQYATVFSDWRSGVPLEMKDACDFVGGDFYGGPSQFSLVCKAYQSLSPTRPFEFMTSRTKDLSDFVTLKPVHEMRIESSIPTLHSAALLFIDAINPDGTINHDVYDVMRSMNEQRAAFEPYLGGDLLADVAVYFDKESAYDPRQNGTPVAQVPGRRGQTPHLEAVVGAARILREAHIPFGVITNVTLDQLANFRAVWLPNVLELTAEQAERFRRFVEQGGILYASGPTSLDRFAKPDPRFLLEDLFGVRYRGTVGNLVTYLTPRDGDLRKAVWPQRELIHRAPMVRAEALPGAEVLATVTLPFADPAGIHAIGSRFAQIISDPPATSPGTDPALVLHRFGKGSVVWSAAPLESNADSVNAKLLSSLLRRALPGPYRFEVDTHQSVEMTLFHQLGERRLLAGLLNMQSLTPPIPVGASVRVLVPGGRRPRSVFLLPDRKPLRFEPVGPYVQFTVEPFDTLAMALVQYE